MGHKILTGNLIKLLGAIIGLILAILPLTPAYADRGMLPIYNVSVYGPGQKAIVAWNGEEEVLILSTDVRASGKSLVLELLPLPSQPKKIEKADFAAFKQIEQLIRKHLPPPPKRLGKGVQAPAFGDGVVVVFHEKIGAHDITVVKAEDAVELAQWAEEFLKGKGIDYKVSSEKLEALVKQYIAEGIGFFVFDLIEVTTSPKSIEPILYQFETDFLYYPLRISSLASGWTSISLFLLTPEAIDLSRLPRGSQLPKGMEVARYYGQGGQPVQFAVTEEELTAIDRNIAELMGKGAWLTAARYQGDLASLTKDLKLYKVPGSPQFVFDFGRGTCASGHKSYANIMALRPCIVDIQGMVITPTPCHELKARSITLLTYPPTIIVDIRAYTKPETICIQCIGVVPFWGKIYDLSPGTYVIRVMYQGKVIGQESVHFPPAMEPIPFELLLGFLCCPLNHIFLWGLFLLNYCPSLI